MSRPGGDGEHGAAEGNLLHLDNWWYQGELAGSGMYGRVGEQVAVRVVMVQDVVRYFDYTGFRGRCGLAGEDGSDVKSSRQ